MTGILLRRANNPTLLLDTSSLIIIKGVISNIERSILYELVHYHHSRKRLW